MLVFAVSVLPWFTARYFTGGVDISSELAIFGLLLVIGTYATMVSCVIAVFNNLLLRIAATIATLWLGIAIAGGIAFGGFLHSYGGGKGPGAIWIDMAMLATTLAFFLPSVVQLMLIAAARINAKSDADAKDAKK
jgi:methyl coenzyme M reductase beta subunit